MGSESLGHRVRGGPRTRLKVSKYLPLPHGSSIPSTFPVSLSGLPYRSRRYGAFELVKSPSWGELLGDLSGKLLGRGFLLSGLALVKECKVVVNLRVALDKPRSVVSSGHPGEFLVRARTKPNSESPRGPAGPLGACIPVCRMSSDRLFRLRAQSGTQPR